MKAKLKLWGAVVLAVAATILAFQNTETTQTHLFFWSVELPRVVLLAVTLFLGLVVGVLLGSRIQRKVQAPNPSPLEDEPPAQTG